MCAEIRCMAPRRQSLLRPGRSHDTGCNKPLLRALPEFVVDREQQRAGKNGVQEPRRGEMEEGHEKCADSRWRVDGAEGNHAEGGQANTRCACGLPRPDEPEASEAAGCG